MLQDPENPFEEWEDEVWAETLDTAQAKCKDIAEKVGLTEVINVTQTTKRPSKQGNYRFICWFRTENSHGNSNN